MNREAREEREGRGARERHKRREGFAGGSCIRQWRIFTFVAPFASFALFAVI